MALPGHSHRMFGRNNPDRRFAHFCRTGDPDALADVFDRTAGRLMRVALWLAGNRTDAEDLLQRTFLQAIETRALFEAGRPVVPWLLGLLGNQARKLRREHECVEAPLVQDRIVDPEVETSRRELEQAVGAVRDRLGAPYSEVLRLHLEEGCNAKEIAAHLARPPGTVRTQLVRALELLRRQLPSGFVAGLAALTVVDAAALAAVRTVVLTAAGHVAPAAAAGSVAITCTTIGGVLMAKKFLFALPVVLLLGSFTAMALWLSADDVAPSPDTASARDGGVSRDSDEAGQAVADTSAVERTMVAAPETSSEPGFGELRVVVHWQHDGSPAVGMGVRAWNTNGSQLGIRNGITDSDGAALLRHVAPGTYRLQGALLDGAGVGEIVVLPGELRTVERTASSKSHVSGRVVDAAGYPVAGARIWLSASMNWSSGWPIASSDARGDFRVPLTSYHYLGAQMDGHVPSFLRKFDARQETTFEDVVLPLRGASARLRGTVRDTRGKPVPWATVLVGPRGGGVINSGSPDHNLTRPNPESLTTDRDGQFLATGVPVDQATVHVWAPGFGPQRLLVAATAGKEEVITITLADAAVVRGVVRDSAGQPIARAGIRFGDEFRTFPFAHTRSDDAGRFRMGDLPALPGGVRLFASNGTISAEARLQLTAGATTEWNPVLGHGRTIRGTVLGPGDRPLAGAKVGVVHPNYQRVKRWYEANADGSFEIQQVGDQPRSVQVALQGAVLREVRAVQPDTRDLIVRLDARDLPTAHLRGRIVDARGDPMPGWVFLRRDSVITGLRAQRNADTGAFTFGPLPAGRYRLTGPQPIDLGMVELQIDEETVLDDFIVQPGGDLELIVTDAAGQPVDTTNVWLRTESGGSFGGGVVARGKGKITGLQPGRYLIEVQFDKWHMPEVMTASAEVHSGVSTPVEIRGRPCVFARITFRDLAPANPDRRVQVFCHGEDGELVAIFSTHPLSTYPLSVTRNLAPGRYQLDCRVNDGRRVAAEIVIQGPDERPTLTIDLPAR